MSEMSQGHDWRPVPDPTLLTTQQLLREIAALREIIQAQREILETRMAGTDRATALLQAATDRVPTEVDRKVGQLRELCDEKFRGIQTQFIGLDTRFEQSRVDANKALDTALQAAKELLGEQYRAAGTAVSKSEAAISKQIDQQATQMYTTTNAMAQQITDLKDRLALIEGRGSGIASSWGILLGALGAVGIIAGIVFAAMK